MQRPEWRTSTPMMVEETGRLAFESGIKVADCEAFGISAPFPADPVKGIMTAPPNNPRWRNVPILGYMREHLGIDGCFENDANCGALAEWFFGAGRGCDNFIYLTMSTGIGGGIIASGRLVRGGGALSAGEIGHMCIQMNGRKCNCGQHGCYEAYCGGRALAQRMFEELPEHPDSYIARESGGERSKIDMILLERAVRANDPYALELWKEMCERNAQALGLLVNVFNPDRIIMGTLAWAIGDLYMNPILKGMPKYCWKEPFEKCSVICSELKREIGSYAGIAAALNYLNEKESNEKQ
ncbi:MAG: ROK family protein [Victivallaceae bacterium]|nr:ROK family protein [Victivallaceae bacterium]